MGHHVKAELPCIDCGALTTYRMAHSRAPRCLGCGIARMVASASAAADAKFLQIEQDRWTAEDQAANRAR